MFNTNNRASFYLLWKVNLLKHRNLSKHYENDFSYSSLIIYFFFYVLFLSTGTVLKITTKLCVPFFLLSNIVARLLLCLCCLLLTLNGDVKTNSGPLTLFRMGILGATHGWRNRGSPFPKFCHTYPIMMKLGTVIPYLN